jgi:imidazole glycerol phosphate synthase glutamine amidotransferase subunit
VKVGLINYGGGNLRSVENALHALGVYPEVITDAAGLKGITHLILPGQGEFGDVMRQLEKRGLVQPLKEWISAGKPYFGICVGFQILFEGSDEAPGIDGLGVVKGRCIRFQEAEGKKIPQMGWNGTIPENTGTGFWKDLGAEPYFYFVHSYYPDHADVSWKTSTTDYAGEKFTAAVEKGKVLACQFHPEKSQDAGLALISNFLGV